MQVTKGIIFLILGVFFWGSISANASMQRVPKGEVTYRLVDSSLSANYRRSWYAASVPQIPDVPTIKRVICQVIRDQKPPDYGPIGLIEIAVYYDLDHHEFSTTNKLQGIKQQEHLVADYTWSESLPNRRDRIALWRKPDGRKLDPIKFVDFDHTKGCSKMN